METPESAYADLRIMPSVVVKVLVRAAGAVLGSA
jgi:hypothetical protein